MAEQVAKLKKKQWYQITAPKQFNEVVIGETLVYDPQAMIGKTIMHSLMNLINDTKKQNISIHFKIVGVDSDKGRTCITGYQLTPYSIKRFVRRSSEKIDLSFNCDTADDFFLRVKPLLITKADVKGSVAEKLRSNAVNFLTKTIKKAKYEEVLNDLISHKLQTSMKEALTKIYPLKICEIRYLGIEEREKPLEVKVDQEVQEVKIEVKEE